MSVPADTTLVLGAGVSGRGAADLLTRLGRRFRVYDEHAEGEVDGVPIEAGPWDPRFLEGVVEVVTSPGFAEAAPPIRDALERGLVVRSEVDFAAGFLRAPIVAVTGTNGKTTTTELILDMLVRSGLDAVAVGNIGTAASDIAVGDAIPDAVVLEVSSFQLRFSDTLHPAVAVVLNVAPDHLDWHGTFDAYLAAKARITARQTDDDLLVHDADDPGASRVAAASAARTVGVSGRRRPPGGWGPQDGRLQVAGVSVALDDLAVSDAAYLVDLTAAAVAALAVGATPIAVEASWRAFSPGAHRRTVVGRRGGVAYVDDSKATNPHAAVASIAAYSSVVLIAGGRNKGLDLAPILEVATLRRVIAIGEAARELSALAPGLVEEVAGLSEAVRRAADVAEAGDTVLLAPGCASFDQFRSYGHRGDVFAEAVRGLGGSEGSP